MKNRWAVPTAIALLQNATNLGLKLGSEGRHTLTVEPAGVAREPLPTH
jgi:hypothetical protein